jgi:hypothetical protein
MVAASRSSSGGADGDAQPARGRGRIGDRRLGQAGAALDAVDEAGLAEHLPAAAVLRGLHADGSPEAPDLVADAQAQAVVREARGTGVEQEAHAAVRCRHRVEQHRLTRRLRRRARRVPHGVRHLGAVRVADAQIGEGRRGVAQDVGIEAQLDERRARQRRHRDRLAICPHRRLARRVGRRRRGRRRQHETGQAGPGQRERQESRTTCHSPS